MGNTTKYIVVRFTRESLVVSWSRGIRVFVPDGDVLPIIEVHVRAKQEVGVKETFLIFCFVDVENAYFYI